MDLFNTQQDLETEDLNSRHTPNLETGAGKRETISPGVSSSAPSFASSHFKLENFFLKVCEKHRNNMTKLFNNV